MAAISAKKVPGWPAQPGSLFSRIPTRLWTRGGLPGRWLRTAGTARRPLRKEMDDKACDSLAAVGLDPSDFMGRFPQDMSGGQAQRVSIARLVSGPKLLVADEPMSAVDVSGRLQIVKVFNKLRAQGISMLMVLHDLGLAQQLADTVVVMHNGIVVKQSPSARCWDILCSHVHGSLLLQHRGMCSSLRPGV